MERLAAVGDMDKPSQALQTHWCDETIVYDGSQLRAHWLLDRFGLVGDALVAFRGPCSVQTEEIADLEDLDGPGIAADDMVHFVWESFTSTDLLLAVHRQRLFAAQVREVVQELAPTTSIRARHPALQASNPWTCLCSCSKSSPSCCRLAERPTCEISRLQYCERTAGLRLQCWQVPGHCEGGTPKADSEPL